MLLPGGKGEITSSAWRSHEIAYGLLVMTPVGMLPLFPKHQVPSSKYPIANSQELIANS
jgi:hypothetical protein